MLGGYGVSGPIGNAAFRAVRSAGLLAPELDEKTAAEGMAEVLKQPLPSGGGRMTRYRFHQQRPRRLAAALAELKSWEHQADSLTDAELRDKLMQLHGVGAKTASWVVRNNRDSDAVAIIDIHVRRAGLVAGVFCGDWGLPRDYGLFESAFLAWAARGAVSAADLDAAIWRMLSALGPAGRVLVLGG